MYGDHKMIFRNFKNRYKMQLISTHIFGKRKGSVKMASVAFCIQLKINLTCTELVETGQSGKEFTHQNKEISTRVIFKLVAATNTFRSYSLYSLLGI